MNNVQTLIGHLGTDVEARYTKSGKAVANFRVATKRHWKDKASGDDREFTEWHNIVVWGRTAEAVAGAIRKGSHVVVIGETRTRSWEDKDGNKRYTTEVVADVVAKVIDAPRESRDPDTTANDRTETGDDEAAPF